MKCPACQILLKDDAKFCAKCGQRIPRCPTCGEAILTRSKYCGKDGTQLPQEVLDLLPEVPPVQPAPKLVTPVQPERKEEARKTLPPLETPRQNPQPPKQSFCAKCGKAIPADQRLCPSCKAQMAQPKPKSSEKSNKGLIVLVAITAVICLIALVLCVLALSGKLSREEPKAEAKNPAPENSGWLTVDNDQPIITLPQEIQVAETRAPTEPATEPPTEPPTEAPTEPEIDADPRLLYFIENCDSTFLSEEDVKGFDKEMCRIARNALYAKSGRMFNDSALQEFFEQFDWYDPHISPSSFTGDMLNKYQSANLNVISQYERSKGYR